MDPRPPRFAFATLFAVVFIDLVGFGIVIPLVPFFAERLGARPELITLIIALHALCQALAMPFWGALSDRHGRRPVLLVSMLGHAGSYLLMGIADSLWLLALARVLSGVTAANLSTAYAYISDITTPDERAGAMGKISAAFGLGFAVGPAIGGLLAGGTTMEDANLTRPAVAAALFSFAAACAIFLFLPEPQRHAAHENGRRGFLADFGRVTRRPVITMMLVLALMVVTFMAVRESIFPLWANDRLGFNARDLGIALGYTGALISSIQFLGIGYLSDRFGELGLVKAAVVLFATAWIGLTLSRSMATCLLALTAQGCGTALFQTSMQSLMSKRAGTSERGLVLGVYQSSSALARFMGQAGAGTLYGQIGVNAPFLIGAAVMAPALWLAVAIGRRLDASPHPAEPQPALAPPPPEDAA
jgi:MFS family permease